MDQKRTPIKPLYGGGERGPFWSDDWRSRADEIIAARGNIERKEVTIMPTPYHLDRHCPCGNRIPDTNKSGLCGACNGIKPNMTVGPMGYRGTGDMRTHGEIKAAGRCSECGKPINAMRNKSGRCNPCSAAIVGKANLLKTANHRERRLKMAAEKPDTIDVLDIEAAFDNLKKMVVTVIRGADSVDEKVSATIEQWQKFTESETPGQAQDKMAALFRSVGDLERSIEAWKNSTNCGNPEEAADQIAGLITENSDMKSDIETLKLIIDEWKSVSGCETPAELTPLLEAYQEESETLQTLKRLLR